MAQAGLTVPAVAGQLERVVRHQRAAQVGDLEDSDIAGTIR